MIRVLAFGTFDIFHPGHDYHLRQCALLGDELYVVIARDETVLAVKGRLSHNNEERRREVVASLPFVTKALLGNLDDKYRVIEEVNPDVIVIGYDQIVFLDRLEDELSARGLHPKIVRLTEGYSVEKNKSSRLRPL